jgi:hypothetical protein
MSKLLRSIPAFCAIIIVACFLWAGVSCKQDNCKSVNCLNGGVCNSSGNCVCPASYSGNNCQTPSRSVFLGSWTVRKRAGIAQPVTYAVGISTSDTLVTDIAIQNLLNYFTTSLSGYVSHDSLYIPTQQVQGMSLYASGYLIRSGSNAPNMVSITTNMTSLSTGSNYQETDTLQ